MNKRLLTLALLAALTSLAGNAKAQFSSTDFFFTGGFQSFLIPDTATYQFNVTGAGGGSSSGYLGGYGATISGNINLTAGTLINIVIGGVGYSGVGSNGGGGGGGTFIYIDQSNPLMIAGGGGGAGSRTIGSGASLGTSGVNGNPGGIGGQNGLGGSPSGGSGGAGFFGDGTGHAGGSSLINATPFAGGVGNTTYGGFGGGGGTDNQGGAGGGGYSGGAGGRNYIGGGGGGSFSSTSFSNISGSVANSSDGYFNIQSVPEPSALSLLAVGLGGLAMMRRRRS
jgi:hypothetical protein